MGIQMCTLGSKSTAFGKLDWWKINNYFLSQTSVQIMQELCSRLPELYNSAVNKDVQNPVQALKSVKRTDIEHTNLNVRASLASEMTSTSSTPRNKLMEHYPSRH
mgnify:FL=1